MQAELLLNFKILKYLLHLLDIIAKHYYFSKLQGPEGVVNAQLIPILVNKLMEEEDEIKVIDLI